MKFYITRRLHPRLSRRVFLWAGKVIPQGMASKS